MKILIIKNNCLILLLFFFFILPLYSISLTATNIKDPINHFTNTHKIPKNSKIIYFTVDLNIDTKPDYFISCTDKSFVNGSMGNIYSVYLNTGNGYLWNHNNSITISYDKLIFIKNEHLKFKIPFLLIERHSIWAVTYEEDQIKEFKLLDLKWGNNPHCHKIFHSILKKDSKKSHPLITLSLKEALNK